MSSKSLLAKLELSIGQFGALISMAFYTGISLALWLSFSGSAEAARIGKFILSRF